MVQTIYRALVVDDEPLLCEATSRAMSAHSFCCDTASDGRQALQKYQQQRHDLVVTDLRMPNYHGHSLILELMKDRNPPHVVVLTGVANSRLVKDLLSRGVQDIVHKPVDFQVFATKMLALFELGNWNPALGQGQKIRTGGNHRTQIQQIETALEIFSLCIPPALDRELSANSDLLGEPSANLVQFLERLSLTRKNPSERRRTERTSVLTSAIAIPVNKDFVVQGDATSVTFNDLSEGGACLFHTRSFPTDYVALRWRSLVTPKRYLKAVLHISRCKPLGLFYEIGGPFVMHD